MITITERIISLAGSYDRRRTRRGWRIYYRKNGNNAPASALQFRVTEMQFKRSMSAMVAGFARMANSFHQTRAADRAANAIDQMKSALMRGQE